MDEKSTETKRKKKRRRGENVEGGINRRELGEKWWWTIPGTDDELVLPGVKGQL